MVNYSDMSVDELEREKDKLENKIKEIKQEIFERKKLERKNLKCNRPDITKRQMQRLLEDNSIQFKYDATKAMLEQIIEKENLIDKLEKMHKNDKTKKKTITKKKN